MLQNIVGIGIGSGSNPLTLLNAKFASLVIFWKQDGKYCSIFQRVQKDF